MSPTNTTTVKKTTRTRKTAAPLLESTSVVNPISLSKNLKAHGETFADLLRSINESKEEFMVLQKGIDEVKEAWDKEQQDHKVQIAEINQQEELTRKREKEMYDYEISLARKKIEDEFQERKNKWEKALEERKEEIEQEKKELEFLRKQVDGFEEEKEKAVKEASAILQKQLSEEYAIERKLREQEVKAENELLAFKIANLTQENVRLASEIALLKKSLEEASRQLKDIAVKVIGPEATNLKSTLPKNLSFSAMPIF